MSTEASRNTPLLVVVIVMAIAFFSLTAYTFSDIHRETAPSTEASAAGGDASIGNDAPSKSDATASPDDATPSSQAPDESAATDENDTAGEEASSDGEAAAPGYGN